MEINQKYILELKQIIASLELEMSKSEISSDPKKMKDCLAQYSTQKKILDAAEKLFSINKNIHESNVILNDQNSDFELREMAKEELVESLKSFREAEKSMRISLIPDDPSDNKNVIIEIRANWR